ncbi:acyltransferase family protein [Pseudomonas sp. NMS19W]|uniref:acyltransferase family protein n=1 Tax=Pseudomonas sp. NMS19W TaxID=3079768 RepID=UPI003F658A98
MLYHFKVSGFTGGFTGVDVFFVISGFLMTGIIFNGLRNGEFSLLSFYASRARRIIPALAVVCIVLTLFGFAYLSLDDYRDLLRTVKDSLLFSSNITFAKGGATSTHLCKRTGCCIHGRYRWSGSSTCCTRSSCSGCSSFLVTAALG